MIFCCVAAVAIPAKRLKKIITLVDGTTVEATVRGDEYFHYLQTANGLRLQRNALGAYEVLPEATFRQLSQRAASRRLQANKRRMANRNRISVQNGRAKIGPASPGQFEGSRKGLVILVNYTDVKMKSTSTLTEFKNMMNQEGYNHNRHIGSVHDYFQAQSNGLFDLTFDVVGPVTVSHNMKYYGGNDPTYDEDMYPATMVIEACKLANASVNFRDYDWDGDGYVDQVYVIYAGYNEAQDLYRNADAIWPHEWTLDEAREYGDGSGAITLDGVKINTYACSSELTGSSGSTLDGIGTCCHEFSHCMGLPDLYDTSGSENPNFGMDSWSLMDYGSYNEDGCVPAAYTAYERMYAGWLTPTVLSDPCKVEGMGAITDSDPQSYVIYNDKYPSEFYVLQNVQQKSWNKGAYGHGLLMIHVDYDAEAWETNTVNNSKYHQRCTVVHADNKDDNSESDLAGDPFPGTSRNTSFTDTSSPAASLFNRSLSGSYYLGKPITNITESNGKISFTFAGGGDDPEFHGNEILFDFAANPWGLPVSSSAATYAISEISQDGATATFTKGTTDTRFWNAASGLQLRCYKGGNITVRAPQGRTIDHITFTAPSGNFGLQDSKGDALTTSTSGGVVTGYWYTFIEPESASFTVGESSFLTSMTLYLVELPEGISASPSHLTARSSRFYDLQGRSYHQQPKSGLYIQNGQKRLAR